MASTVPPVTFGAGGFVAPSEQAVLTAVQADINQAFGGNLNPGLSTPQGQLATSEAAIIGATNDAFLFLTQMFDPAYSTGRYQDALYRIYFLERLGSQPTVVQATCSGQTGIVIPAGSLAKADDGNIYISTEDGTIPAGGSVVIPFACTVNGPISCPDGSLNTIFQAVSGWDHVTNLSDGVLGNATETRSEFYARYKASVAQNSRGSLPSVLGAVLNVAGVLDAYVTENVNGAPVTVGGQVLVAHSLYVAVVGGAAQDVAGAIWSKKAPGCNYNGNTTVTVVDSNSGYTAPLPSYQVTFEIPPALPVLFAVVLANNSQVPANAVTLVRNAIIAAFAGLDGGARARIGSSIFASRYYGAVAALGAWAEIVHIDVSSSNTPGATFTGSIAGTALTVTAVASGTIAIGQTLSDAAGLILPGTKIASGAGSAWVVSNSQTVGSRTMIGATPNLDKVDVQINQSPTLNAANIAVTLV